MQLSNIRSRPVRLSTAAAFKEGKVIADLDEFVKHLWSANRAPARHYAASELPTILSMASDGTYARVMQSEVAMRDFVGDLERQFERAANMDW